MMMDTSWNIQPKMIPKVRPYALVAQSGSGKSTIAQFNGPAFYDVQEGEIKIDGIRY